MSEIQPDYKASYEFLQRWQIDGPWVLVAIDPNKKGIEARTFGDPTRKDMLAWLEEQGTRLKRNIYFTVNQCVRALSTKPSREHIAALNWLHVDLDPRAGEDIDEERERIRKLLEDPTPLGIPKPTCITFSGGGYQAFWRLRPPQMLDGTPEQFEDAKRWNKQLELLLGGDNCHNIDRIMRLPGTVNRPDKRKRAKGRVEVLAEVVEFGSVLHDIKEFTKAPEVQGSAAPGFSGGTVQVSGNVSRFSSVDEIEELKGDQYGQCRVVIVQGIDPDEPDKFPGSRSEWLFFVCCEMVRAGCDADTIYSVITDPDFGISDSVLDKGSGIEEYAVRQIERATSQSGNLILDPGDPMPSAEAFVRRESPELMHYNGDWLDYDGAAYREVEDGIIESRVYRFLQRAKKLQQKDKTYVEVPFKPNSARVSDVLRALRSAVIRARDEFEPPCWIGEPGPPPTEIISCSNGLLHLPTGELHPPTPRFFTRNALAIAYDPAAPEPVGWQRFLIDLWASDPDSIRVLQEVFGYLLVPDTSQQKLFFLKGPPRSGKGTIARVLRELVGAENACSPSLPSLGTPFGLEPLAGRSLAIVSDARDSGRMEVQASIAENLLRISGEDAVSVHRKFKTALDVTLSVRFLIMSNLRPKLPDASGALGNRFVPIVMTESFLGQEDPGLTARLLGELPGILNWAIEGWRRLQARGFFEPSSTGRELLVDLVEDASPIMSFVREECELDPLARTTKAELYEAYKDWRLIQGMSVVDSRVFGKDMQAALPKVKETRPTVDGRKVRFWAGIKLVGTELGLARRLLETWAQSATTEFGDEHEQAFERLWGEEDYYSGAAWNRTVRW